MDSSMEEDDDDWNIHTTTNKHNLDNKVGRIGVMMEKNKVYDDEDDEIDALLRMAEAQEMSEAAALDFLGVDDNDDNNNNNDPSLLLNNILAPTTTPDKTPQKKD